MEEATTSSGASAAAAIANVSDRNSRSPHRGRKEAVIPTQHPHAAIVPDLKDLIKLMETQQTQSAHMFQAQQEQNTNMMQLMSQIIARSSNPAPAPTPTSAPPEPRRTLPKLKQIPAELIREFEKQGRAFKQDVLKYSRAQHTLENAESDLAVYEDTTNDYPNRTRKFKSSAGFAELDELWQTTINGPHTITFQINQGLTMRQAMACIHRQCAKELKAIDVQALKLSVLNKQSAAHKDTLKTNVEAVLLKASTAEDYAHSLGLPKPLDTAIEPEAVTAKLENIYSKIYGEINLQLKSEHDAAEKAKNDDNSEITSAKPGELLDGAIDNRIDGRLRDLGFVPQDSQMVPEEPANLSSKFIHSMGQKNEQSPPSGAGHNQHNQQDSLEVWPPKGNRRRRSQWRSDAYTWNVPEATPAYSHTAQPRQWWNGVHAHAARQRQKKVIGNYGYGANSGGQKEGWAGKKRRR